MAGALSEFLIRQDLRKGISVKGTLTLRGVKHLDEAYLNPRRAMEVMCHVLERNVASVAIFTMESED